MSDGKGTILEQLQAADNVGITEVALETTGECLVSAEGLLHTRPHDSSGETIEPTPPVKVNRTVEELLATAREIWGPPRMMPGEVCIAMAVVHGDICRAVRDGNREDLEREMGNMILSTIRWCDDLGLDVAACLEAAERCQRTFAKGITEVA